MLDTKGSWDTQDAPDGEEEKVYTHKAEKVGLREVVEISSDEDIKPPRVDEKPVGKWDYRSPSQKKTDVTAIRTPLSNASRIAYGANYMRSRVVESSDSETEEPSRPSTHSIRLGSTTAEKEACPTNHKRPPKFLLRKKQTSSVIVEVNTDSDNNDDGSILVFDEPKSARKPKRLVPPYPSVTFEVPKPPASSGSLKDTLSNLQGPGYSEVGLPGLAAIPESTSPKKKPAGTPRNTSKKRKEDQQARLYTYAASFFEEINRTVFKGGLPEDTKLNWNKRLLTTAGRAKWHRSRDGIQTSEIELAEKILTSQERIRNTLSHEMCHLASWVIDKEIKEGHGKFWKAWTRRVMSKYPDIDISTRHDYEIEYPYKWKCAKCDKIYGRFSKSIKPNECVCGACREGRLIPQFTTNTRTPRTPKMSRMAAATTQGSPYTPSRKGSELATPKEDIVLISSDSEDESSEPNQYRGRASICEIVHDSDSDIEVLAVTFTATSITDS